MKLKKLTSIAMFLMAGNTAFAGTTHSNSLVKLEEHHKPSILLKTEKGVQLTDSLGRDQLARQPAHQAKKTLSQSKSTLSSSLLTASQPVTTTAAATNVCVTSDELAAISGATRTALLKTATDFTCLEDDLWSSPKTNMGSLFNEASMITIAQEARLLAIDYDGTNANNLQNFLLYLRVGVWAQYGNDDVIGDHSVAVSDAIAEFLDAFAANQNYYNTDETHGLTVKEAMVLMSSKSEFYARYLPVVINWLNSYEKDWGANMQRMLTKSLILIYRARKTDDFIAIVESDMSLLNALNNFLKDNTDLIGSSESYQFKDVASELGRILRYSGEVRDRAKVMIKDFLTRYTVDGEASSAWLKLVGQIEAYDADNCDYYNICNFRAELEAKILPITHHCSDSLTVRAQDLTGQQLTQICDDLSSQETYFHQKLATGMTPVADDNNRFLELVIYDSSSEYKKYSGIIFGNSTDNGGQYLEGDPSKVGNIPRFFAHEAEWLLPEFAVWNLTHEYIHYLDGRFNMYGDFRTGYAHNTTWWSEGLAEYISLKDLNDDAIEEARKNTYQLSELFSTRYGDGSTRIYDWGYLAVRYFFEKRASDISSILNLMRNGDYDELDDFLANIGTSYDSDFANWLQEVESKESPTNDSTLANGASITISSNGEEQPGFLINLPESAINLEIKISGGSGDADLHVKYGEGVSESDYDYRPWKGGNNETVTVDKPASGLWSLMANPYKNRGFNDVTLTVSWEEDDGSSNQGVCHELSPITRGKLKSESPVCIGANLAQLSIWVDSGMTELKLTTIGGEGDGTLYHSDDTWTTTSRYYKRSKTANTNEETIIIRNPRRGWHYVTMREQGEGVTLEATLQ
ncbi:M9 family metallopeptidase [Aliikangiella coralliicola]|uniref:microbial collagenase n=1 Tax=Aliikangiella coralliicola TaxID=2592383 RepID=A0A545UJ84_9GAMM|nr:M9 family metallopeptidase [Aliikangiella coralliicola]TQV89526.1 hypothetical protein FLL46_01185 [Aliikangiella coralliicola]